jgi:hypothetical protein
MQSRGHNRGLVREEEVYKLMGIGHSQEFLAEPIRIWKVSVFHNSGELVSELIGYNNLQGNVVGSVLNTLG